MVLGPTRIHPPKQHEDKHSVNLFSATLGGKYSFWPGHTENKAEGIGEAPRSGQRPNSIPDAKLHTGELSVDSKCIIQRRTLREIGDTEDM